MMIRVFNTSICILFFMQTLVAQDESPKSYRNFPLVISLQFHAIAMPFKNIKSNFSNIGIGIGTEISHSGMNNWLQKFDLIWYRNKRAGNGFLLQTMTVWRSNVLSDLYAELGLGVGYKIVNRPNPSFIKRNNEWVGVGKKAKGMFAVPATLGMGHYRYASETDVSPYIGYQVMLLNPYNNSIPIMPESLFQMGSKVHFKR